MGHVAVSPGATAIGRGASRAAAVRSGNTPRGALAGASCHGEDANGRGCIRLPRVAPSMTHRRSSGRLSGSLGRRRRVRVRPGVVAATGGGGDDEPVVGKSTFDFEKEMQADMERLAADSPLLKEKLEAEAAGVALKSEATERMEAVKNAIDTFLLYDFFVILFILSWLVVGVILRLSYHQGLSYDEPFLGMWLFLWPWLFQPLLGIHMLATIVSPIIGKLKDANLVSKDTWT